MDDDNPFGDDGVVRRTCACVRVCVCVCVCLSVGRERERERGKCTHTACGRSYHCLSAPRVRVCVRAFSLSLSALHDLDSCACARLSHTLPPSLFVFLSVCALGARRRRRWRSRRTAATTMRPSKMVHTHRHTHTQTHTYTDTHLHRHTLTQTHTYTQTHIGTHRHT
jgi:hypothetical protein